jgi:hypothetical protein
MGQPKMAYEILVDGQMTLGDEEWDFWLIRFDARLTTEQVWEAAPSPDVMDRIDEVELLAFAKQQKDFIDDYFPIVGLCRTGESPIVDCEKGTLHIGHATGRQPYWSTDCSFLFIAPPTRPRAA